MMASNIEGLVGYTVPDVDLDNFPLTPVGEQVLIQLPTVKDRTAGGIALPESTRKSSEFVIQAGKVLKIGPEAFARDYQRVPMSKGSWFKVGDWVIPGVNQGQHAEYVQPDGTVIKCKFIHVALIVGTTTDPSATATYF